MKRTIVVMILAAAVGVAAQGRGGRGQGDGQIQGIAPGQPAGSARWTRLAPIPEAN
jgi:hypothetical protein